MEWLQLETKDFRGHTLGLWKPLRSHMEKREREGKLRPRLGGYLDRSVTINETTLDFSHYRLTSSRQNDRDTATTHLKSIKCGRYRGKGALPRRPISEGF